MNNESIISGENGKRFTEVKHADGRVDVKVEVSRLDIKPKDAEEARTKKVIEEAILPRLEDSIVRVVVIHKPTNQFASKSVSLPQVRAYAEACVKAYNVDLQNRCNIQGVEVPSEEFVIVEVHEGTMLTRVTNLQGL